MKGFTLIELMIVIAVTGIVLSVAAVKFDAYAQEDELDKAAYKMKYDITYMQNLKISDTRNYKILVDNRNDAKSYTCFRDDDDDDIPDAGEILTEPATKGQMIYQFAIPNTRVGSNIIFKNVVLSSVNIFTRSGVSAVPGGICVLFVDKYGALRVRDGGVFNDINSNLTNTIVLSRGVFTRTLTLYPLTSDMKIE